MESPLTAQEYPPQMHPSPPAKLEVMPFLASSSLPAKPPLGTGNIHVWLALRKAGDLVPDDWQSLLSPDELSRMARYRFVKDQQDYLFARGMLRILLGAYLELSPERLCFSYSSQGKPSPANSDLKGRVSFNLSHTNGAAMLAVCQAGEIGVDIEAEREDVEVEQIASRFFSPAEREQLMQLPEQDRRAAFFRCWTRKEALLKAKGGGLSLPLDVFDVSIGSSDSRVTLVTRVDPDDADKWLILPVPVPHGYAAAVAVEMAGA
jgi:4'-phosphopantetheinyl transferase